MHFCRDFSISLPSQKLIELFKKNATNSKELNYNQFVQILNIISQLQDCELSKYLNDLGLDNWRLCQTKMKYFQKPFSMKDNQERIQAVKYQFKVFHPDLRDQEQIKQILQQRKEQSYYLKNHEKEKKEYQKLLYQLKHFTKEQLFEKFPHLSHLIEKLPNTSKPTTCSYILKDQHQSLTVSEQRQSALTWESLNKLPAPSDFVKELVDEEEEDDQYLQEYQIEKNRQSQEIRQTQQSMKKRSFSDYASNNNKIQQITNDTLNDRIKIKSILKQQEVPNSVYTSQRNLENNNPLIRYKVSEKLKKQRDCLNYSVDIPKKQLTKCSSNEANQSFEKPSPTKFNISMLKRVQEISGLEAIKEKNLLNQIISQQREKQKYL